MEKMYMDEVWLRRQYLGCEKSAPQIAKEIDANPTVIYKWLRKHNIPVRSNADGIYLSKRNKIEITPYLKSLLEGELLGDGGLQLRKSGRSALYQHTTKHREYLEWLSGEFASQGLEQSGKLTQNQLAVTRKDGIETKYSVWQYASLSYPELAKMKALWYPEGKKIVPKNIVLNPIVARQWYIGDGSLTHLNRDNSNPYIVLATCAFSEHSINTLIEQLSNLGFQATHQKVGNIIYIRTSSVKDFLDYMGPSPVSCYDYKFDYSGRLRTKPRR